MFAGQVSEHMVWAFATADNPTATKAKAKARFTARMDMKFPFQLHRERVCDQPPG
jgi:hypothetical protein